MIRRPTVRNRQTPSRGFAVLLVAWLNLVVAPCALAEAGEHDCAHCPPGHGAEMAAHHGHAPPAAENPCATLQADCCEVAAAAVDSRVPDNSTARKPQPEKFDTTPAFVALQVPPHASSCMSSDPPDPPASAAPPRHVLNCVYLD